MKLESDIDFPLLFYRLQKGLCVGMEKVVQVLFASVDSQEIFRDFDPNSFQFVHCDITYVKPKVSFMHILDEAEVSTIIILFFTYI